MYLCYDIKGIQRFIFSVPRLKCVIGASALIAEFDADAAARGGALGAEPIYAGGGRGAFYCAQEVIADQVASTLVKAARRVGLDIRLGLAEKISEAAQHGDRFYPCWPEPLDATDPLAGEPCAMSAQWPVPAAASRFGVDRSGPADVHPLVWLRVRKAREDGLGRRVLQQLRDRDLIPARLTDFELSFFRTVTTDPSDSPDDQLEAEAGRCALGDRNRWAIVALDGNDMGRQFLEFERRDPGPDATRAWLGRMSASLDDCNREAFLAALAATIASWCESLDDDELHDCVVDGDDAGGPDRLILPFRPLILGGDDVTLLCHNAWAMRFVQAMTSAFRENSRRAAEQHAGGLLWPATGGELTMSGGILYCKVTFPLHLGIPYAESLLSSAKGRYRAPTDAGRPTPAAVDWDVITDSLVDTPAARRNRELRFLDPDLADAEVQLTRRPYLLEPSDGPSLPQLSALMDQLAGVPGSVRARILPGLQRPWSERVEYVASIAKRHPLLKNLLWEGGPSLGDGWIEVADNGSRATSIPDALMLLEEERRIHKTVVDA